MQTVINSYRQNRAANSPLIFVCVFILCCIFAALLIGWQPLTLSIVTIFLFAGIHNFFEFRYFLARMPIRWGKSKIFYSVGIGGTILLTGIYLLIYFGSGNWLWSLTDYAIVVACWNTLFILWFALLFFLRGKQKRKDWSFGFAVAFLVCSIAWMFPNYWSLSLVYIHPFIAMWFLERQIRRTKPEWLKAYHFCLATIPLFILGFWFTLSNQPDLSEENRLFWRITQHAGSAILPNISSHFLVSLHVFLETIHYAVWIILIPLIDFRAIPWKINEIPLFSKDSGFPKLVVAILMISVMLTICLWLGFLADYTLTRDVYFAFAMAHVLAEMPFLIKMM
jgi:hypothetical protein